MNNWYKPKTYAHFDSPLSEKKAVKLVSNPENIKKHEFLPFLSFNIKIKRYGKKDKLRPIKYASHKDAYIFSYYADKLSPVYEKLLKDNNLDDVVIAYRKGVGSNIELAKSAFDVVKGKGNCIALGYDISGFFDSLDHQEIKKQWIELLNVNELPPDHYAVYKALTKFSHIDRDACYKRLGYSLREQKTKRPICDTKTFRDVLKSRKNNATLIQRNDLNIGIPQGTAISALLANIYMYKFDKALKQLADELGGNYYRYSDDILFVCSSQYESRVQETIKRELKNAGEALEIKDEKTLRSEFVGVGDACSLKEGSKPFEYLGFSFDGKNISIRQATIQRYWKKANKAIKKAQIKAYISEIKHQRNGTVFKRKIYRQYTHLGGSNFISYAKRASKITADNGDWKGAASWKQVKNTANKISLTLKQDKKTVFKHREKSKRKNWRKMSLPN